MIDLAWTVGFVKPKSMCFLLLARDRTLHGKFRPKSAPLSHIKYPDLVVWVLGRTVLRFRPFFSPKVELVLLQPDLLPAFATHMLRYPDREHCETFLRGVPASKSI